ncbi:hypothetical protein C882_1518 [Caenispirillum salinarum AK4]|uniref:Uncharacterized protein n=1 Tax=Caenispirillum salinarum AK4 TaxID=1238182 RepID=K9HX07_9PROT|nr:hypothetical protein [Caenispirillum salinarum]EKV32681.1 hypothetical protein C882_1518 [Caenispirillum salinarum AK4]
MRQLAPDEARQARKGRAVFYVLASSLALALVALAAVALMVPVSGP